jgi:hypothetical protein
MPQLRGNEPILGLNKNNQTNLPTIKPLVGDEIQHREINIGRNWDRVGGSVTLVTYLTDLCLGSSSHTILPMCVLSKELKLV